ncbi:hypothetical protein [Leptospira adleri]|uniref:ParB/Sulfiredoxin domain-containing protein n=1 Tax=Leptospira adleri TaxID=2023186 RepID=A0A2M9YJD1_9LEPT|nr:hypothetical protein [Leptospira adleri]PJZ51606.1 hypothetical protein CH380_19360 [Leptospira adleri]PJZ61885.1 hypothetical protein CH376_10805 [Leptospira adleri]
MENQTQLLREKHPFNLYPEMQADEFALLLGDMEKNGYDETKPVILYESKILDGWHRYKAAKETNKQAKYESFKGSELEALNYTMRSNFRRNLNASQRAAIATEYLPLLEMASKQRSIQNLKNQDSSEKGNVDSSVQGRSAQIAADLMGTNSKYVNEAAKLKNSDPKEFNKVKAGTKSLSRVKLEKEGKRLPKVPTGGNKLYKKVSESSNRNSPSPPSTPWKGPLSDAIAKHLDISSEFSESLESYMFRPGSDFLKAWTEYKEAMRKLRTWCVDKAGQCVHCKGTTEIFVDLHGDPLPENLGGFPVSCPYCMDGLAGEV